MFCYLIENLVKNINDSVFPNTLYMERKIQNQLVATFYRIGIHQSKIPEKVFKLFLYLKNILNEDNSLHLCRFGTKNHKWSL